jgi:hypothetical protein
MEKIQMLKTGSLAATYNNDVEPFSCNPFIYHEGTLYWHPDAVTHSQLITHMGLPEKMWSQGTFGRYSPYTGEYKLYNNFNEYGNPEVEKALNERFPDVSGWGSGKTVSGEKKNSLQSRTASLLYKFVWANGELVVGPGWRKDIHHLHLMQDLGITSIPENFAAGTYKEDDFTGQPAITHDWPTTGTAPSDEELIEMIQQYLNHQQQHIGRISRKPW